MATVVGGFFGVIGPFGSFAMPLALRCVLWIVGFWIGASLYSVTIRAARRLAPRIDLPEPFAIALGVALISVPYSAVLGWMFNGFVWRPFRLGPAAEFYGYTLLFAAPLTALNWVWAQGRHPRVEAALPHPVPALAPGGRPTTLLDRLPPRFGRELMALQMEDHYVRAHTERGSDLILTPLKDAIAELSEVEGMQVHRSWWVARRAVEASASNGRNLTLKLKNGLEAPVSRASVAKLKAAGWIADT